MQDTKPWGWIFRTLVNTTDGVRRLRWFRVCNEPHTDLPYLRSNRKGEAMVSSDAINRKWSTRSTLSATYPLPGLSSQEKLELELELELQPELELQLELELEEEKNLANENQRSPQC